MGYILSVSIMVNNAEIEFEDIGFDEKKILLDILGYGIGEKGIIFNKETNEEHICPVTKEVVTIEEASILPGSTIVMNTTELSLSEYFLDYVERSAV
jgi:hypothetical protein